MAKFVKKGDYILLNNVIAEIVNSGKIKVIAYLGRDEIDRINPGDDVKIKIDNEIFNGVIDSVAISNDDSKGQYEAEVSFDAPIEKLVNLSGKIIFKLCTKDNQKSSYFVEKESVIFSKNKPKVFLVENDKAKSRTVKLGEVIGAKVEVLEGLAAGDGLIVENMDNLR